MTKDSSKKQVSRLTGALLARKGAAAPSSATLSLHQPAINRFSHVADGAAEPTLPDEAKRAPLEHAIETVQEVTNRQNQRSTPEPVAQVPASRRAAPTRKRKMAVTQKPKFAESEADVARQKRIAMTLRMDEDSHLKLRLFSAHTRKSCQVILSEALELYLDEMGDSLPLESRVSQQ
ncbi:hypothetical protein [Paremcibacter congregatus]|uniref:hypothetical protein n=1 Tax=Paremcibacter congregatus TaxID=2043170 RepID=UPI003A91A6B2